MPFIIILEGAGIDSDATFNKFSLATQLGFKENQLNILKLNGICSTVIAQGKPLPLHETTLDFDPDSKQLLRVQKKNYLPPPFIKYETREIDLNPKSEFIDAYYSNEMLGYLDVLDEAIKKYEHFKTYSSDLDDGQIIMIGYSIGAATGRLIAKNFKEKYGSSIKIMVTEIDPCITQPFEKADSDFYSIYADDTLTIASSDNTNMFVQLGRVDRCKYNKQFQKFQLIQLAGYHLDPLKPNNPRFAAPFLITMHILASRHKDILSQSFVNKHEKNFFEVIELYADMKHHFSSYQQKQPNPYF
jgi:hypothetical protein